MDTLFYVVKLDSLFIEISQLCGWALKVRALLTIITRQMRIRIHGVTNQTTVPILVMFLNIWVATWSWITKPFLVGPETISWIHMSILMCFSSCYSFITISYSFYWFIFFYFTPIIICDSWSRERKLLTWGGFWLTRIEKHCFSHSREDLGFRLCTYKDINNIIYVKIYLRQTVTSLDETRNDELEGNCSEPDSSGFKARI